MKAPAVMVAIWMRGECCIRGGVSGGTDHSEYCVLNFRVSSRPSSMTRPGAAAEEDGGQGEGCEGGKCTVRSTP